MLPDLSLHQVRLLLDHSAATCSTFPPCLFFKLLLLIPPGSPWGDLDPLVPIDPLVHGWM